MIVNLYIFSTDCPLTEAEWKNRSIELCESEPPKYHCMYNSDCQLVEFCAEKKYNNFGIYLINSGQEFLIKNKNEMFSNSKDYWIIQDILYCKKRRTSTTEKPIVSSTTGQPSTIGDNQENVEYKIPDHCYVSYAVSALLIVVVIVLSVIYLKWNGNNETPRETSEKVKFSTVEFEDTLVLGKTECR